MRQTELLFALLFGPIVPALADDYSITVLKRAPLEIIALRDYGPTTNLVGKTMVAIFGSIAEVRVEEIGLGKSRPDDDQEELRLRIRERIDKARCLGREADVKRSMVPWLHGYLLLRNGRIIPLRIMLGGILAGGLIFEEQAEQAPGTRR